MFRSGASGPSLQESAPGQQRDDAQHLGGGTELQDGEQVGEVIPQHVPGDRDRVLSQPGPPAGLPHSLDRGHEGQVQTRCVLRLQIFLGQGDDVVVVGPGRVQPENGLSPGGSGPGHGEPDPVPDRGVLGLTHPPDVALLHRVTEDLAPRAEDPNHTRPRHSERLVVAAVLLSLLSHQTHITGVPHSGPVKLPILPDFNFLLFYLCTLDCNLQSSSTAWYMVE